jgi:ubiquinone/menaquinone biosynthesis C-methylase UbiE
MSQAKSPQASTTEPSQLEARMSVDWPARFEQQAGWTRALREHLYRQVGLATARRILEVGCGTGAVLSDLAERFNRQQGNYNLSQIGGTRNNISSSSAVADGDTSVGSSANTFFGLDLDAGHLRYLVDRKPGLSLVQGDGHRLPYADGSFEVTLAHFLLLWVRDPLQVVREMKRVTLPGGAVLALAEPYYSGRVDYPSELTELGWLQAEALRLQGADPNIGRRLRLIFHQAGLVNATCGVLGGEWSGIPNEAEFELEWQVLRSDLADTLSNKELDALQQLDLGARNRGERVLFVPTFYSLGWVG